MVMRMRVLMRVSVSMTVVMIVSAASANLMLVPMVVTAVLVGELMIVTVVMTAVLMLMTVIMPAILRVNMGDRMTMTMVVVMVMMVMPMVVIIITSVAGAATIIRLSGEQIEKADDAHANPGDEHHVTEDAIWRQVGGHATADVKVEKHSAPDQHDQDTEEVNSGAGSRHGSERAEG